MRANTAARVAAVTADGVRVVRELVGRVRNVVLIKCILDFGKPKRGWNFGWEGTGAR